jgi:hypothetical protein
LVKIDRDDEVKVDVYVGRWLLIQWLMMTK